MNRPVAQTIRRQLGNALLLCVRASNLVALNAGLQFKIPGRQRFVTVTLTPADEYDVRVWTTIHGTLIEKTLATARNVPVELLKEIIYQLTEGVA